MFLVGQYRMATTKELWDNAWTLFNYFTCKLLILKNFNLFSMFVALQEEIMILNYIIISKNIFNEWAVSVLVLQIFTYVQ